MARRSKVTAMPIAIIRPHLKPGVCDVDASADFAIIRRGITNAQAAADDAGGRSGAPGGGSDGGGTCDSEDTACIHCE